MLWAGFSPYPGLAQRVKFVSDIENQHYIPQFFLRQWCDTRGNVTVYARRNGRVVTSPQRPKGTAFEENLYSLEGIEPERRHIIEAQFMTRIDTPAAEIVRKILSGGFANLTVSERSDFARFLLSLRARHPDAIALVREKGPEHLTAALALNPDDYVSVKSPSSPATLVEWVQQHAPPLIQNFGIANLPGLIANDEVGERVFRMNWWVHDVSAANTDLLLGDRPCLLEGDAVAGDCLITLPLSPKMLFFACNQAEKIAGLCAIPATKLVKAVNRLSVISAKKRVYAAGRDHLPLVEKYLRPICAGLSTSQGSGDSSK
jgi:hypothetical protein